MKNLLIALALSLISGITFGQSLQKGNLIGMHVMTINLDPDVTTNQFMDFFKTRIKPEIENNYDGWKVYIVKGIRGENQNSYGLLYVIKSEEDRNKYYNEDGSLNELGSTTMEKFNQLFEEGSKLGTWSTKFTDWVIQ
jgi:hypothetical protein